LENYVVRIYRREKNDPRILVGVIEEVGVEGRRAFSNLDELWGILNSTQRGLARWMRRKGVEES
jgi:hypothetical protein